MCGCGCVCVCVGVGVCVCVCGCFDNCVVVLLICVLVFTVFCIVGNVCIISLTHIILIFYYCSRPGSSVGIATDYGLDGPESNPGGGNIFRPSRPALGPT